MNSVIPVNEPVLSKDSKHNVIECLETGWVSSSGKFIKQFEQELCGYLGMKYGVAVSSGTAALHVALLSLGVGPGDEVIVPAFTMAATWLAVLYVGAKPVFVDCELETYNLDPKLIEEKITKRTKAIIPVHIYGHPVDMDSILKIAKKHKLWVIEDAAEAHGAEYQGQKCGSFGDINCFSFYGNKIITTGEGGMVVTNDPVLADKARKFRDLHHSAKRFIHDGVGYNYRMTNMQAALGCGQLKHIDEYITKKRHMADLYSRLLSDIPGLKLPVTKPYAKNVYWMYAVVIDEAKFGMSRDKFRETLKQWDIDTRDFFYAPSTQPILARYLTRKEKFPNTEYISHCGLYLPSGLAITDDQIHKVAGVIRKLAIV